MKIPTDNANKAIQDNVTMQVTQPAGQVCNRVTKNGTNTSYTTSWSNLKPICHLQIVYLFCIQLCFYVCTLCTLLQIGLMGPARLRLSIFVFVFVCLVVRKHVCRLCLCVCVCTYVCVPFAPFADGPDGCVQMCALVQMGLMGPARLPDLLINTSLPPCLLLPHFHFLQLMCPARLCLCVHKHVFVFVCLCVQLCVCVCVFPLPLCLLLPHFTFFNHKHILQIRPGILRWSTRPFSP